MLKVKVKLLSHVWLFVTPRTEVHGIFQARILEWVVISFSNNDIEEIAFIHLLWTKSFEEANAYFDLGPCTLIGPHFENDSKKKFQIYSGNNICIKKKKKLSQLTGISFQYKAIYFTCIHVFTDNDDNPSFKSLYDM